MSRLKIYHGEAPKITSFTIPPDVMNEVIRVADEKKISRSRVVVWALREALKLPAPVLKNPLED
jgi:metal-responsive CopG/Arc/MetJ family transcriptional regulator